MAVHFLSTMTNYIKEKKYQDAYDYWKKVGVQYFTTFKTYDAVSVLLDSKWVIICTELNLYDECIDQLERLSSHKDVQYHIGQQIIHKLIPFIEKLPSKKVIPLLGQSSSPFFKPTNPSIIRNPLDTEEFIINVRHVNYHCDEQNQYHCNDPNEKIVHTQHILYFMDSQLSWPPKKVVPLTEEMKFMRFFSPVQDLEDLRLVVRERNSIWGLCNSREILSSTMPQQLMVEVDWSRRLIKNGVPLISHDPATAFAKPQKNWLPFFDEATQTLRAIYCFGPMFIVYDIDQLTGNCSIYKQYPSYLAFENARGGSSPIRFKDDKNPNIEWMSVVHYAYDEPKVRRKYYHRFVFLGKDLQPLYVSYSFVLFEPHSIQFVMSACSGNNDTVYLGVGQNDVEAYILEIDNSVIRNWKKISLV